MPIAQITIPTIWSTMRPRYGRENMIRLREQSTAFSNPAIRTRYVPGRLTVIRPSGTRIVLTP